MNKFLTPLFSALLSFSLTAHTVADTIDQVALNTEFTYGIHQLKWIADPNNNQLIDLGEAHVLRNKKWQALDKNEFTNLIKRRRANLHIQDPAYTYKKTPTRDLNLYLDLPEDWQASDKRPAIIWFFGGAWTTGSPFHFKPQAAYFAKRGLVCIRPDYRIKTIDDSPSDGYLSGMDAKTALRWVRKNAAQLGIDPDNIMTGGGSAGGHLAIATQLPELNDPTDDLTISTKVSALLMHNPYVVRINDDSWIYKLDFKSLPPVWVGYSTLDKGAYTDDPSTKRGERSGESFVKELTASGIPLRTYIKDEGGHGFCSGPPHLAPSTADIADFLEKQGLIKPAPATQLSQLQKSGGALAVEHLQKVERGELTPKKPKTLQFVSP